MWKERGLFSAQGSPTKHKEEIAALLKAVQQPKAVAIMHCKAHQMGTTRAMVGNRLAARTAKAGAKSKMLMALIPPKGSKIA